jgi:hypothetical protein
MDQAIAIIIASAISVIGGICGTLCGVLISNNNAAKVEDKRIKHEEAQEKARIEREKLQKEQDRHRALLEELCSLVYISQLDMSLPFLGENRCHIDCCVTRYRSKRFAEARSAESAANGCWATPKIMDKFFVVTLSGIQALVC